MQALNQVEPYDWAGFLNERLNSTSPEAPVGGLEASGWKVDYTAQNGGGGRRGGRGGSNTTYSIGLNVQADGTVADTIYGGPAFQRGRRAGDEGDRSEWAHVHGGAVGGCDSGEPGYFSTNRAAGGERRLLKICTINYHDGEKFPHLVPEQGKPDYLDEILKPLAAHSNEAKLGRACKKRDEEASYSTFETAIGVCGIAWSESHRSRAKRVPWRCFSSPKRAKR